MSWIAVIGKGVWHGLEAVAGIEQNPGVAAIVGNVPIFGPIINTIFRAVINVESLLPKGNGALKKTVAMTMIKEVHPATDDAIVSTKIDKIIAALNILETELKSESVS